MHLSFIYIRNYLLEWNIVMSFVFICDNSIPKNRQSPSLLELMQYCQELDCHKQKYCYYCLTMKAIITFN